MVNCMKNINSIVEKIKWKTNENGNFIYRKKFINDEVIFVIYNETVCSSDSISDFVIRSLDCIEERGIKCKDIYREIVNSIDDFKVKILSSFDDIIYHINSGFTLILVEGKKPIAVETKKNLSRGISSPLTENSVRGAMDSFNENIETNIGLIYRRIRSGDLWVMDFKIGKYTGTKVSLLYVNGIVKEELVDTIKKRLENIDISGIINSGQIKNLIENEDKSVFPTIISSERPDTTAEALLNGKVVIVVDNSPFVLIMPGLFSDYFIDAEDRYNKGLNVTFTRIVKYLAFYISLLTPAFYIAITTYNQEMIPTLLIINFAAQRNSIPFPAFFEALIMILAFEILRESDLRIPNFTSSALSIVGALILGEAAVNAGLVSPIMIIVVALTSIAALSFSEQEIINGLRWYRLFFMVAASFMGMYGLVLAFTIYIIKMASLTSFGKPYLMPFIPTYREGLKNSIVKFPEKMIRKRVSYLSNNSVKMGDMND